VALAKYYDAALLTVDSVVLEAISNGNTPAGMRARELCADAAHRRAEEARAEAAGVAVDEGKTVAGGGLSVEALQAHTAGQAAGEFKGALTTRYCHLPTVSRFRSCSPLLEATNSRSSIMVRIRPVA